MIPIDEEAERYVLGSHLQGYRVDIDPDIEIDPEEFGHEGCRTAYLASSALRANGYHFQPVDDSPAARHDAASANVTQVACAMQQADIWRLVCDPAWFLNECVHVASLPELVGHYANKVRDAAKLRRIIDQLEQALRLARRGDIDGALLVLEQLLQGVSA